MSKKLPETYKNIVTEHIIVAVFNNQTKIISKLVIDLSKLNIAEVITICQCQRRLIYTLVKKEDYDSLAKVNFVKAGELLTSVLKKEKMAKNVLSAELIESFLDLE